MSPRNLAIDISSSDGQQLKHWDNREGEKEGPPGLAMILGHVTTGCFRQPFQVLNSLNLVSGIVPNPSL